MSQISPETIIRVFQLIIGSLAILAAIFNRPLFRLMGLKPLSEVYTTPRFQQSARLTDRLGRLLLAVIGIAFLIQGVGAQFLSGEAIKNIAIALGALSGLIIVMMVAVVLRNWRG